MINMKLSKRILAVVLVISVLFTSLGLDELSKSVQAVATYTTIYFKDETSKHWIGDKKAVMELVDNTTGHDSYIMKKVNSTTWSAKVPATVFNVTFNRLSPDDGKQWNSWSAGGRGKSKKKKDTWSSTYHATVPEHGYWDGIPEDVEGFHEGDVIYLDYYEYQEWGRIDAAYYVNFTSAINDGDKKYTPIVISKADKEKYKPIQLNNEIEEMVYTYTVTAEDEGAPELRFWRGNGKELWNSSIILKYTDYQNGNNCVKVLGENNTGYVCPYVPRRHVPQITKKNLEVSGNKKVNRKIILNLELEGEEEYIDLENTKITIKKLDSDGNVNHEAQEKEFLMYDEEASEWNHRELIFKESGTYKVCTKTYSIDEVDCYETEEIITIVDDNAPVVGITMTSTDEESNTTQENIFVRNKNGELNLDFNDQSVSEINDEIVERNYKLYFDKDKDGKYSDNELIDTIINNQVTFSKQLKKVGKYKVVEFVKEHFEDTIPKLLSEDDYLSSSVEVEFEIVNKAPISSVNVKKSKIADIIFTVGNADNKLVEKYGELTERVKEIFEEKGIEAKVSTVESSSLTAKDTFAWKEYDHYNYNEGYSSRYNREKHIENNGNDIKMVGYTDCAFKDFLYVAEENKNKKIFEFDMRRNANDWHTIEGGGFLFNTVVTDDYIKGYCLLLTKNGINVYQIKKTDLNTFRNTRTYDEEWAKPLYQNVRVANMYASHHWKIVIDKTDISVFDGEKEMLHQKLPEEEPEGYGYGTIVVHRDHNCGKVPFFTFGNIVMQTLKGDTLSDVVNNHEWTPGDNHYVINLSEENVLELSDNNKLGDVAAALISNSVSFYGIGNDKNIEQYNTLLNSLDGKGENILLSDDKDEQDEKGINEAFNHIVEQMIADVNSKDYEIKDVISSDEKVEYTGTYQDFDGDEKGEEKWIYEYDSSVFASEKKETQILEYTNPIEMFVNTGAYTITHMVSDILDAKAENDDYKKLILSQHRPLAEIKVDISQNAKNHQLCNVNVQYSSMDEDHIDMANKGIRKEEFYYKQIDDSDWTVGRFPANVEMGTTYLIKYIVTDVEGTQSRPCVVAVKTSDAKKYEPINEKNAPKINLMVSKASVEIGEKFYVEASAEDDTGIVSFEIKYGNDKISNDYGHFELISDKAGEYEIKVTATDYCGNTSTETKLITVVDSSDVVPPTIDIVSPTDGKISGDTDIVGTINDNKELKSYVVKKTKIQLDTEGNQKEEESVVIAKGTKEVNNETIATIEASNMSAGMYRYEILAEDAAGNTSTVTCVVTVTEDTFDKISPEANIDDISFSQENGVITVYGSVTDNIEISEYILFLKKNDFTESERIIGCGTCEVLNNILGEVQTSGLSNGQYDIRLVAVDKAGNKCECISGFSYSKTVQPGEENEDPEENETIEVEKDLIAPVVAVDVKTVVENDKLKIKVIGTIDDENLSSYQVSTGRLDELGEIQNAKLIANGDKTIKNDVIAEYVYDSYEEGKYGVLVTGYDAAGNYRTIKATITVNSKKLVEENYSGENEKGNGDGESGIAKESLMNLVLSRTIADLGSEVKAYITYPKSATNVKVTAEGADVELSDRVACIKAKRAGELTVVLHATIDGEEKKIEKTVRFFDRSDSRAPVVQFISPEADSTINNVTDIYADISDETSLAYYVVEYKMQGENGEYIEIGRGTNSVKVGNVAQLDTTTLMNGCYIVRISAVDNGGNISRSERKLIVDGNLKIGKMAIGFTDINANVSGVPLTVTRNYNSNNKNSGDFGYGWTMGIQSAKIAETNPIIEGYKLVQTGTRLSTTYELKQTLCHDVIVTYGDGTTDRFKLRVSPERSALVPIQQVNVYFQSVTNNSVKLELAGAKSAFLYGNQLVFDDFEFSTDNSYILTRADGTKLYLNTASGLNKIQDTNGNYVNISSSGFRHSSGNSVLFTRDKNGRIINAKEVNKEGKSISEMSYTYDEKGDLVTVKDQADRNVSFVYDNAHNLKSIIDPMGIAVARNEYDDKGRLVRTWDAAGKCIEITHDLDKKMEVVRDRNNQPTIYYYDNNGNIIKTVDVNGNMTENKYDENNNVTAKKDASGFWTYYSYDDKGQVTKYTDKNGNEISYKYNDFGQVIEIKNPDQSVLSKTYDAKGNLLSESNEAGISLNYQYDNKGNMTKEQDANGNTVEYRYDTNGNVIYYKDFAGNITEIEYDDAGRELIEKTTYADSKKVSKKSYSYDKYGNKTETYINDTLSETNKYNACGKLEESIDEFGNKKEYVYDKRGNLISLTTSYDNDETHKYVETYEYDDNGNKTGYTDKYGKKIKYINDNSGKVLQINYPNNICEKYTYNERGDVITYTNKKGYVVNYVYDGNGNKTEENSSLCGVTKYVYNSLNQMVEKIDAKEKTTKYEYDLNGNQTKVIYSDDTFEENEYDNCLNKISYKDREGKLWKYSYDCNGNLTSVIDSKGNVTNYEYDLAGNQIAEIDANKNKTSYLYDINGNMIEKTLPNGEHSVFEYNEHNQLLTETDFNGVKTQYSYLENGKIEKSQCSTGEFKNYEYDEFGQLQTITTENGKEEFKWENGKIVSKTDCNGETIDYTYDGFDMLSGIKTGDGKLDYEYDQLDRMITVKDESDKSTSYTYDILGNLKEESLPNGVTTTYEYNDLSELTTITSKDKNEKIISQYQYELGENGERKKATDYEGNSIEYSYDDAYQLVKEQLTTSDGDVTVTDYTYDPVGNRLSMTKNGDKIEYSYNKNNQLIKAGNVDYSYDANGNLINKVEDGKTTEYKYNAYNRLISVSTDGIEVAKFKYDSENNRVYSKFGDKESNYVVDSNREISQVITKKTTSEGKQQIINYVYGNQLINQEVDGTRSYYLYDGQLSVRKLVDKDGKVTDNYSYDAFGNMTDMQGTTDNEFLYTGQQYDIETGLYYLRARYMNPNTGNFISRDFYEGNVFEPKTLHKYSYVSNDPVNNYDPQGLWMQKVILGILAHRFINIQYILEHPGHDVNRDRKNGYIKGLNLAGALKRGFVDIIDYTSREIYEIKPYNGVVDGAKQVDTYIEILQYMFGEGVFSPGTTWPIPARVYEWPLGGALTVYLDQPGVIHYHLTRNEVDEKDSVLSWNVLRKKEFDVGYVCPVATVLVLAASLPKIISFVNSANRAFAENRFAMGLLPF